MFHQTSLFFGGLRRNADFLEELTEKLMLLKSLRSGIFADFRQLDAPVLAVNVTLFFQLFERNRDARLRKVHELRDVGGAASALLLDDAKYALQIIFARLAKFVLFLTHAASFVLTSKNRSRKAGSGRVSVN